MAEGIMVDLWRDFWIRETGTGQQVAQLHDIYDDDDDEDDDYDKVHMNMCVILNDNRGRTFWVFRYKGTVNGNKEREINASFVLILI